LITWLRLLKIYLNMLQIYNSFTQKKEPFKPINPPKVGIYVCGLTVYDYCHIGNARVFTFFDTVVRYLKECGFEVNYVRNITDIDDKIIDRAAKNHETVESLTKRFIKIMHEDARALGALLPTTEPLATEHIADIINMISILKANDYAYVAKNGDVYYNVKKFVDYGKLAHQDLENLKSGIRIEASDAKRDPLDFVLWKLAKPNEPSWDSPWGKGRPGWHSECAAMSTRYLGKHFDIHGGGADLQFPHHQNEAAQAEIAYATKFVNIWMHIGYVQVNKEKMSKSAGNFFVLREALKEYDAEVIRYFLLSSHYRSPLDYSPENLVNAKAALERFYLALRDLPEINISESNEYKHLTAYFYEAMNDDFNTPKAIAALFDIVREINRLRDNGEFESAAKLAIKLRQLGSILGILQKEPKDFLRANVNDEQIKQIEELINKRKMARKNRSWEEADQIRDQLTALGIELEDTAQGTVWRIKQ
jgi:cysteinyl-tRNA synthetase